MKKETKQKIREVLVSIAKIPEAKEGAKALSFLVTQACKESQAERDKVQQRINSLARMDEDEIKRRVTQQLEVQKAALKEEFETQYAIAEENLEAKRQVLEEKTRKLVEVLQAWKNERSTSFKVERVSVLGVGEVYADEVSSLALKALFLASTVAETRLCHFEIDGRHLAVEIMDNELVIGVFDESQWCGLANAVHFSTLSKMVKRAKKQE